MDNNIKIIRDFILKDGRGKDIVSLLSSLINIEKGLKAVEKGNEEVMLSDVRLDNYPFDAAFALNLFFNSDKQDSSAFRGRVDLFPYEDTAEQVIEKLNLLIETIKTKLFAGGF